MEEKSIELSGGKLVYLTHGKGPPLVFLHGGIATPRAYIPLFELLGEYVTIIAPTHPGHGDSFSIGKTWRIEDFIATYREFFRKLGIEPFTIIGHSLGGMLALLLAAEGIGKKFILFDPAGLPFNPTPKAYLSAKKREATELLSHRKERDRVKKTLSAASTLLYTAVHHPENIPWLTKQIPAFNIGDVLKTLVTPVELFWGNDDGIVPISIGRQMAKLLPKCDFHILKHRGHTYPVTHPEFTFELIKKSLGLDKATKKRS